MRTDSVRKYVLPNLPYVTPEMLAERMELVKAQEHGPKRPIAEQMKDAQRQADKQERPALGKDAPGRGEDR